MTRTHHFLILSDGKKGHENQSLGLVEALLRRTEGSYEIHRIQEKTELSHPPTAIIAAGHRTHWPLIRLARKHRCPAIVIMKPSLPTFLFSHCLIPEHDLMGKHIAKNVIPTKGALNRIPEKLPPKQNEGLIMLGGPSKHFEWAEEPLVSAIQNIVTSRPDLHWTLGDSRRTPDHFLNQISEQNLRADFVPHHKTGDNWLRDRLLVAKETWVTPDSTSMIFEALTSGCHVGTLPLNSNNTRLSRAHEMLGKQNWITPFSDSNADRQLPPPPHSLHETARCAEKLLPQL